MPVPPKKSAPLILLLLMAVAMGAPPGWWSDADPPVIDVTATENNQGPANIGQAKHMAKSALDVLCEIHPGVAIQVEADLTAGANPIIDFTIPDPKTPEWIEQQKAPLLIGQLKAIADPFYTRLNAVAPAWIEAELVANQTKDAADPNNFFPWTTDVADDNNKSIATIGQLKAVFSLRFTESVGDNDGIPDLWEMISGLDPNDPSDASLDPDDDGYTNLEEYQNGTDPYTDAHATAGVAGAVLVERWFNVDGWAQADIFGIPTFSTGPDSRNLIEGDLSFSGVGTDYAQRIRGTITMPQDGDYRFYLTSDGASRLWVSPTSSRFDKRYAADVFKSGNKGLYATHGQDPPNVHKTSASQKSDVFTLSASTPAYFEILHKHDTGSEHLSVVYEDISHNYALATEGAVATQSSTYTDTSINALASNANDGNTSGALSGNDVSATADELNSWLIIDFGLDRTVDHIKLYNDTENPTRLSNFRISLLDDQDTEIIGKDYYTMHGHADAEMDWYLASSVLARKIRVQLLGQNNDGNGILSLAEVQVFGFNLVTREMLRSLVHDTNDLDVDGLPDDWEVANGLSAESASADDAGYGDPDKDGVSNFEEYVHGTDPQVRSSIPGCVSRDVWGDLSGYSGIDDKFVLKTHYLESSDVSDIWPSTHLPVNYGKAMGQRVRWVFTAPAGGDYQFYVAGDDRARLILSKNAQKFEKRIVVDCNILTTMKWNKAIQESAPVTMVAGEEYFMEAYHKQGPGPSDFAIGWLPPGATTPELLPVEHIKSYPGDDNDLDDDYLPDSWEVTYGLDPNDNGLNRYVMGEYGDADNDGLTNHYEYLIGTNPRNFDSDGDGMSDAFEVLVIDYDLNDVITSDEQVLGGDDFDGDGATNWEEYLASTNPAGQGDIDLPAVISNLYNPDGAIARINTMEIWDPGAGNDDIWQVILNGVPILQNTPQLNEPAEGNGIQNPLYLHPGDEVVFEIKFLESVGEMNGQSFNLNIAGELLEPYESESVSDFVLVAKEPGNEAVFGSFINDLQADLVAGVVSPAGGGYWKFTVSLFDADADADGLQHTMELALGSDPFDPDSDDDGMIDGWEVAYGLDPLSGAGTDGANSDNDNDDLTNIEEYESWAPPAFWTVPDGNVNNTAGPLTVEDSQALWNTFTDSLNPNNPDTDNDGMADGWEAYWALRDSDPQDTKILDPLVPGEQSLDYDEDGLSNVEEFAYGGNPFLSNSDQEVIPEWGNLVNLKIGDPLIAVPVPGNGQEVFDRVTGYPYMDPSTYDDSLPLKYLPYRAPTGKYDYNGDGVFDLNDVPPAVVFASNGLPVPDGALNPGFYYFDPETAVPYLDTNYPEEYFDVETVSILPYDYPAYSARGSDENDNPREMVEHVILRLGDTDLLDANGDPVSLNRLKFVPGFGEFVPDPLSIEYIELDAGMDDFWEARHGLHPFDPQDSLKPSLFRYGINNLGYFLFRDELAIDSDGDLIPDILEQGSGFSHALPGYQTDPLSSDTDGDGLPDGYEILYKLNPNDASDAEDTKNATVLSPYQKYQLGLHPEYADSDLDEIPDAWEVFFQSDLTGVTQDILDPGSLTGGLRVWWNFERASGDLVPDDAPFDQTVPHDAKLRGDIIGIGEWDEALSAQSKYLSINHEGQPFEAGFMLAADRPLLALGTTDFTLGFWMQWLEDENDSQLEISNLYADERQVFSKEGAYEAIFKPASGILSLRFHTSSGIVSADFPVMEAHEWHHIAVTYDVLTGEMDLYQNGQLSSSISLSSESLLPSDRPLIIGSPRAVPSQLLNMSLDDWRLYDVVLTQSDISLLAHPRSPLWDRNKDRSSDGVTELQKFLYGMDPFMQSMDTDGDEIPDHMEMNGFQIDEQGNPVANSPEQFPTAFYADPRLWDTDGDGLGDLEESRGREITLSVADANGILEAQTKQVVTNLLSRDTDGDRIDDRDELEIYSTDPTNRDTDEDDLPDGFEIANGLNPLDARDASLDLDGDGLDNLTEYQDGERKVTVNEESLGLSALDSSGDGLNDLYKSSLGLDINSSDTSGDGLSDFNALSYGLDPLDPSEGSRMAASGQRTVAEEAADGLNPMDPSHQSVVIAPPLPLGKTGFVPHDATAEKKIEEFIKNRRNRMHYPVGSSNPVLIAGSKELDAFGVLEKMTLKGVREDGSETSITLGGADIENSFTTSELGKSLHESALGGAQNITGFIGSLARDENGYVDFWATFTSTKNLLEEDDDPDDNDNEVQVSVGTSSGGGGWGGGGGYGGGGGWGYFPGGSGIETPAPQAKPTLPEEAEQTYKAKANSRIVVFNEAATVQLAITTPAGDVITGSRLLDPYNSFIPLNDDFDEGLTDPQTGELLPDNSNDGALLSDPDLAKLEVTLHTSTPGEGVFTLSVPGAVNIFDSSGQSIPAADLTVDLTNPIGPLAGLANGQMTLYFEGVSTSADAIFTAILNNGANTAFRQAHVNLLPVDIVPDYNRDGKINDEDRGKVTPENPWRWWVNDDDDFGEAIGGDVPGAGTPDYLSNGVDGLRDLVDFFPVHFDLKAILEIYPRTDYSYYLTAGSATTSPPSKFSVIWYPEAHLDADPASTEGVGSYLKNIARAKDIGGRTAYWISRDGLQIPYDMLDAANNGKGVALIEGRARTDEPIAVEIRTKNNGTFVTKIDFPVLISGVEDMFRHINLTTVAKNYDGTDADILEPAAPTHTSNCEPAYPDELTNGKYFVFLHGFNVSGQAARGWHAEIFKRMHQMGSKARFVGVTWNGDTGLPGIIPDFKTADYHKGVFHAFQTGDVLNDALAFTSGADVTVAAHSLGNMVVSHAIQDGAFRPDRYYLINAAVAKECYDPSEGTGPEERAMTERDWKPYFDLDDNEQRRLFAANWYELFPNDARTEMRWTGRFQGVLEETEAYSFYSPGDEIVQNPSPDADKASVWETYLRGEGFARGAWPAQEYVKGGITLAAIGMSRDQAGWSFNYFPDKIFGDIGYVYSPALHTFDKYSPANARDYVSNDDLRAKPFFAPFREQDLFDATKADAKAREKFVLYDVLARGVPAKSFAVAPNTVNGFVENINMEEEGIKTELNSWPIENHEDPKAVNRWLHSDFRDVALPYVFGMYDKMIDIAQLNEPPVQP